MSNSDIFASDRYWLTDVHVPIALIANLDATSLQMPQTREGLVLVNLEVQAGIITRIQAAAPQSHSVPTLNCRRGIAFPCFIDMHTHLDKGHIWERAPNLEGTFDYALMTVKADSQSYWDTEDVYRRMEFGLKCSYAHGTQAIRTHLDAFGAQASISFDVFQTLRAEWQDRITLQAVSLVPIDYFQTPEGEQLADRVAATHSILGGLVLMSDQLDAQLDRVFALAQERGLALDFHTDESGDPDAITLRHVAQAALRHDFTQPIVCGHCCSLAVQSPDQVWQTLELVKQANIGIVSLPMCNLYLQDRNQMASQQWIHPFNAAFPSFATLTPRWRGVTLIHELKQMGIPVAVASDNCRDPFHGFGDHDGLEVLTQSTRIAHLDTPYGDWCRTMTQTPAQLMGLPNMGQLAVGQPANLIVFKARYFSELLSRPQSDRTVLRQGKPIDTALPDYAELDDLVHP